MTLSWPNSSPSNRSNRSSPSGPTEIPFASTMSDTRAWERRANLGSSATISRYRAKVTSSACSPTLALICSRSSFGSMGFLTSRWPKRREREAMGPPSRIFVALGAELSGTNRFGSLERAEVPSERRGEPEDHQRGAGDQREPSDEVLEPAVVGNEGRRDEVQHERDACDQRAVAVLAGRVVVAEDHEAEQCHDAEQQGEHAVRPVL